MALSLGSPRAEVIRRLFTVEPGLSSTGAGPAATARPSGGAVDALPGGCGQHRMQSEPKGRMLPPCPILQSDLHRTKAKNSAHAALRGNASALPRPKRTLLPVE